MSIEDFLNVGVDVEFDELSRLDNIDAVKHGEEAQEFKWLSEACLYFRED